MLSSRWSGCLGLAVLMVGSPYVDCRCVRKEAQSPIFRAHLMGTITLSTITTITPTRATITPSLYILNYLVYSREYVHQPPVIGLHCVPPTPHLFDNSFHFRYKHRERNSRSVQFQVLFGQIDYCTAKF